MEKEQHIVYDKYRRILASGDGEYRRLIEQAALEKDLTYADLQICQLSGLHIYRGRFHGADFSCSVLSGSQLHQSDFSHALFVGSELRGCRLCESNFSHANFYTADLSGSDFRESNIIGADFSYAITEGTRFDGAIIAAPLPVELTEEVLFEPQ